MMMQLMVARLMQGRDRRGEAHASTPWPRLAPDLPMYVWGRGIASTAMGDYDGAERAFAELIRRLRRRIRPIPAAGYSGPGPGRADPRHGSAERSGTPGWTWR